MLTYDHVRIEIRKRFKETEDRLKITRDNVILGLLDAVQDARVAGNPMGMIKAYREFGLLMGYYPE